MDDGFEFRGYIVSDDDAPLVDIDTHLLRATSPCVFVCESEDADMAVLSSKACERLCE